jgi:hypothetical protein
VARLEALADVEHPPLCCAAQEGGQRTDELRTCFRLLLEREGVQWQVGRAAEWLYSRAGEQPVGAVLATLPVLFGVRGAAEGADEPDLDSDIVWEWEGDRHHHRAYARYHHGSDEDDGGHGAVDDDGWHMYRLRNRSSPARTLT